MIKLYRPDGVDWHNMHSVEADLSRLHEEGWRVVAVVPDVYSNGVTSPTFVLERP